MPASARDRLRRCFQQVLVSGCVLTAGWLRRAPDDPPSPCFREPRRLGDGRRSASREGPGRPRLEPLSGAGPGSDAGTELIASDGYPTSVTHSTSGYPGGMLSYVQASLSRHIRHAARVPLARDASASQAAILGPDSGPEEDVCVTFLCGHFISGG